METKILHWNSSLDDVADKVVDHEANIANWKKGQGHTEINHWQQTRCVASWEATRQVKGSSNPIEIH